MSKTGHHVAIVYHYIAHYRRPIFNFLSGQNPPDPEYTVYSGTVTEQSSIKLLDPELSRVPPENGGLHWKFLGNIWIKKLFLWQRGLTKLALGRDCDTIIFLGAPYYISTWVGAALARLRGKRVLMWTHGLLEPERGLKLRIRMSLFRLAHGLLVYGNRAAQLLSERGIDPDRLYVVFNSLEYDRHCELRQAITDDDRRYLREKLFDQPNQPLLITTGRVVARKRLDMVLNAMAKLDTAGLPCNWLLIGDGPALDELKALAESLGLNSRVCFYGACYEEETVGRLIDSADLCVSPGQIGLTCMHSLSFGTPVITHDDANRHTPEFEAVLPGLNGAFFKYGDTADLARSIHDWIESAPERDRVRRNCFLVIDRYYNPYFQVRLFNEAVRGTPARNCPQIKTLIDPVFPATSSVEDEIRSEYGDA